MDRLVAAKAFSEKLDKLLLFRYEAERQDSFSKTSCIFEMKTNCFSIVNLDQTKQLSYSYQDILKIQINLKNHHEFSIYLQNVKKIFTYSTNERSNLLCDLAFCQLLHKHHQALTEGPSKSFIDPSNPII